MGDGIPMIHNLVYPVEVPLPHGQRSLNAEYAKYQLDLRVPKVLAVRWDRRIGNGRNVIRHCEGEHVEAPIPDRFEAAVLDRAQLFVKK